MLGRVVNRYLNKLHTKHGTQAKIWVEHVLYENDLQLNYEVSLSRYSCVTSEMNKIKTLQK